MSESETLKFHPLAEIFPLIEGAEFDDLVADINVNGLHEPIVVLDDLILDGRNRYRACLIAGVEPLFVAYRGDDPVSFVISHNLRRRHLDESQRATVAAKLATLHDGQRADLVEGLPIGRAAKLLNVGERSVARAREVLNHGAPELVTAVERGDVSVSAAADVAELPKAEQAEIVARGEREILLRAKEIRGKRVKQSYAARMEKFAEISKANTALPEQRYPVIYADPPWKFEPFNEETGGERSVPYPVMDIDELKEMPIPAMDDCVLFMWSTSSHLADAVDLVQAWGFTIKTTAVWVKPSIGLGYLLRNRHELLLIATRGDIPAPLPEQRPDSVIEAPRGEHSAKPVEAYQMIERMYPDLPRIELFSRSPRQGWAAWGNQSVDDPFEIPPMLRRTGGARQ
jgi:N6-adenosine-specific RNA methylase IME4/ParB-like chromosome segregation protein Spo0J